MLIVAVLPSILFPPKKPVGRPGGRSAVDAGTRRTTRRATAAPTATARAPVRRSAAVPAETIWVKSPLYRFGFSTAGGLLAAAELLDYRSFTPGDSGARVQLIPAGRPLLTHRLIAGSDTVSLSDWAFTPNVPSLSVDRDSAPPTLTPQRAGARVTIEYAFFPGEYRFRTRGSVTGLGPSGGVLLARLGDCLRSVQVDSSD